MTKDMLWSNKIVQEIKHSSSHDINVTQLLGNLLINHLRIIIEPNCAEPFYFYNDCY